MGRIKDLLFTVLKDEKSQDQGAASGEGLLSAMSNDGRSEGEFKLSLKPFIVSMIIKVEPS
jgi:hypothetical protein